MPKRSRDGNPTNLPMEWIGTWNNYKEGDAERLAEWCREFCVFANGGFEKAPTTGTPHIQSFHQMGPRTVRFTAFKQLFPEISVKAKTYGDGTACAAYSEKDGNLAFKVGEFKVKKPGARSDLAASAQMAVEGSSQIEIARADPVTFARYAGGISRLVTLFQKPRDRSNPKICHCLYGPTDTWKTRRVFDYVENTLGEELYVWDPAMEKWFCGYGQQKYVLLDEFRGQLPYGFLLRLLDRYPMRVQSKFGSSQFVADYVFVTSPMAPEDWYPNQPNDRIDQLLRRFTDHGSIVKVTSREQEVAF